MKSLHTQLKRIALATAIATAAITAAPAAMAQSHHRDRHDDQRHDDRHDRHDSRYDRSRERAYHDRYQAERRDYRNDRRDYRRWTRGQYIPRSYVAAPYYVNYRTYRLAPPPRGYAWVRPYRDDGTYYMVQLATGLIAQALIR